MFSMTSRSDLPLSAAGAARLRMMSGRKWKKVLLCSVDALKRKHGPSWWWHVSSKMCPVCRRAAASTCHCQVLPPVFHRDLTSTVSCSSPPPWSGTRSLLENHPPTYPTGPRPASAPVSTEEPESPWGFVSLGVQSPHKSHVEYFHMTDPVIECFILKAPICQHSASTSSH